MFRAERISRLIFSDAFTDELGDGRGWVSPEGQFYLLKPVSTHHNDWIRRRFKMAPSGARKKGWFAAWVGGLELEYPYTKLENIRRFLLSDDARWEDGHFNLFVYGLGVGGYIRLYIEKRDVPLLSWDYMQAYEAKSVGRWQYV